MPRQWVILRATQSDNGSTLAFSPHNWVVRRVAGVEVSPGRTRPLPDTAVVRRAALSLHAMTPNPRTQSGFSRAGRVPLNTSELSGIGLQGGARRTRSGRGECPASGSHFGPSHRKMGRTSILRPTSGAFTLRLIPCAALSPRRFEPVVKAPSDDHESLDGEGGFGTDFVTVERV